MHSTGRKPQPPPQPSVILSLGSPATGPRRRGEERGPHGQVFVRGVEVRGGESNNLHCAGAPRLDSENGSVNKVEHAKVVLVQKCEDTHGHSSGDVPH